MDRKRMSQVTLMAMLLTFTFWFAAAVTPGWMIVSITKSEPSTDKSVDESMIFGISIFYSTLCNSGICEEIPYDTFSEKTKHIMLSNIDLQIEAVSALVSCMTGLYLLLFNKGSRTKIAGGGIAILVGALVEIILVIRLAVGNSKVANAFDKSRIPGNHIEIGIPYSLILAGVGLLFSIMAVILSFRLYTKAPKHATQGQVLNKFPASSNEYTNIQ
ncbi:uncharacterized protein LOC125665557 isoform X2 [Ostrea edulis]|nr:uncharacterized protein LOC125665557 isoform X2 [Ostrea edulis]XP_048754219.2 uncharacterized protein LOC125665557 isoform X2 [Ostrea edulis]XP_056008276.1 uncharacterized protein LOC130051047 isoform X2 [Ostrea edulis]XP_056008277.1 uncharacterized protein LOC130051047 isoform X2 [Ostrea edulis]XP_056008278.1 uncharacterized protein LOC130051047 isoform X2 [Ostrea edulis]XP_056008279.1 uncharacterized protein LOC125665557 isoform X2 [Ostrea edulis]